MTPEPRSERVELGDDARLAIERVRDDMIFEYYKLSDLITAFDQRLLTIKGWGVTFSLASLGFAFQQQHYGLFLVAALSGLAFWIVEALTKRHQMRLYPRMRDIEVAHFQHFSVALDGERLSSPQIDWAWKSAPRMYGELTDFNPDVPQRYVAPGDITPAKSLWRKTRPVWLLHVAMPHVVSIVAGLALFTLGIAGRLDDMPL